MSGDDLAQAEPILSLACAELAAFLHGVRVTLGCNDPMLSGSAWIDMLLSLEWKEGNEAGLFRAATMLTAARLAGTRRRDEQDIKNFSKERFLMKQELSVRPLSGKVALVTGASRGIGAAIAKRLARDGAHVVFTYAKDAKSAADVAVAIESEGVKALALQADGGNPIAVRAAVAKAVEAFGRIDILVNNAGTAIPKPFEEATLEELEHILDLNVKGVFVATQEALKNMPEGGRIISIGSCVGERTMTPGLAAYSATKGAVKMFTQGLAREVGHRKITVNNVQPGPIDTDLNPASGDWAAPQLANTSLKRYGKTEEVAALVAFVAGPESSYITGANLTVDGGTNA